MSGVVIFSQSIVFRWNGLLVVTQDKHIAAVVDGVVFLNSILGKSMVK